MTPHFASFVAIDWSGAKGRRHKGIAIAEARGDAPPRLIRPGHVWSREEVLRWLLRRAEKEPTLFGFDFSFAPPIVERGEYLPGESDVPNTAHEFWAYVDERSDDEDLGAASFLEQVHRRHFYFGIADGVKADFMRFRQCDQQLNRQGGRKTASAFDAIGAAQVNARVNLDNGTPSLGQRVHRKDRDPAVDPVQQPHARKARLRNLRRAGMPGTKLRTRAALNEALAGLDSKPARLRFEPNDHQTDALVTAAGMRELARNEPHAFQPPGLTPELAQTEGWTFGIL